MKTVFRYFLLLGIIIIPLFFLYKDPEQFPVLFGAFLGVTLTYWIAVVVLKRRGMRK